MDFAKIYNFMRDRLRAISQEFNVQSIVSEARIKVCYTAVCEEDTDLERQERLHKWL
jgi:hypothetical protein